jgi:NAD(P)-dependent dehydrogenase (short-subunit alcohol dehydrogenase family)
MSYVEDVFGLSDRIAVITGAGGVIAGVIAEAYLKAGAKAALWEIRAESLPEMRERFAPFARGPEYLHVMAVDSSDKKSIEAALNETTSKLGEPNVLVNTVGGNQGKSAFIDADLQVFESVLRINLMAGLVIPTQVFAARWMKSGKRGCSIINMASMGSYVPLSGVWAYDAAKAGVLNLTQACAKEFGPAGIRVNAIAPGFFLGKQNFSLLVANKDTGELTERGKDVIRRTPYGRFGTDEDLRGVAMFLASEKASGFVTGVSLPVDGGFLTDNI